MNSPIKKISNGTTKNVVDPFCSLLSDDLQIKHENGQLKVVSPISARSKRLFEQAAIQGQPLVNGEAVDLDTAVAKAANLLKRAKQPLMAGLGTDLSGMRAAIKLAEQSGAVIDHMYGDKYVRNTYVLQSSGWIMTTMAEIRNRADLVILLEPIPLATLPLWIALLRMINPYSILSLKTDNLSTLAKT